MKLEKSRRLVSCGLLSLIVLTVNAQSMSNYVFSNNGTGESYVNVNGTAIGWSGALNQVSAPINIGFDFWYMGARYTQVVVSSNGVVSLGGSGNATVANNLKNESVGRPFLAPLWDTQKYDDDVYHLTSGSPGNRLFKIEWRNWEWEDDGFGYVIDFQLWLSESDGSITYHYNHGSKTFRDNGGGGASIGISGVSTGNGNFISVQNNDPSSSDISLTSEVNNITSRPPDNKMIRFTPAALPVAPSNLDATVVSNSQINLNWQDNSSDEIGFVVYYSLLPTVPLDDQSTCLAMLPSNTTSASVTGLSGCSRYYFKVYAVKEYWSVSNVSTGYTGGSGGNNYYVNDNSSTGDRYCTVVGAVGNTGALPSSPKNSVGAIINSNVLGNNDTVFIDAGNYTENIVVTAADDGSSGCGVVFIGVDSATSIINPGGVGIAFKLTDANYVTVKNLKIFNAGVNEDAVEVNGGEGVTFANCWIINNQGGAESALDVGTGASGCTRLVVKNCRIESGIGGGVDLDADGTTGKYHNYGSFYDNDFVVNGGYGIGLDYANYNRIFRNNFTGTGNGIAINSGAGSSNYNVFYNNYFSTTKGIYHNALTGSNENKLLFNSFYTTGICLYFDESGGNDSWEVKNNIFYTTGATTSDFCIRVDGSAKFKEVNCNVYYYPNGSARCAKFNGTNYAAFTSNWQSHDHADDSSDDANSFSFDPLYVSAGTGNLDLNGASSALGNACSCSESVVEDIHLYGRPINQAIGAYDNGAQHLPVELYDFSVHKDGRSARLRWITQSEVGVDHFKVAYSNDGINFEAIGIVETNGYSQTIQTYYFEHNDRKGGLHYYKLIAVDDNEKVSYQQIKYIIFEDEEVFYVFPNPIEKNGFLQFSKACSTVQVFDISGKQLLEKHDIQNIYLENFVSGVYIVRVNSNDKWEMVRVVVK